MTAHAMRSYASAALDMKVDAASPHALVLMLFEGALREIRLAKAHLQNGEKVQRGKRIGKAVDILLQGLAGSLDHERGGELADRLGALYAYCGQRLTIANARGDVAALDEVLGLLEPLRDAWSQIPAELQRAS